MKTGKMVVTIVLILTLIPSIVNAGTLGRNPIDTMRGGWNWIIDLLWWLRGAGGGYPKQPWEFLIPDAPDNSFQFDGERTWGEGLC